MRILLRNRVQLTNSSNIHKVEPGRSICNRQSSCLCAAWFLTWEDKMKAGNAGDSGKEGERENTRLKFQGSRE